MTIDSRRLGAAALAGLATGGRTFAGLAALAQTAPPGARSQPDATLDRPGVRIAVALTASGELVFDQLPAAPSRLAAPGLGGRIAVAALCGVIIARREPVPHPTRAEPGVPLDTPGETPDVAHDRATAASAQSAACAAVAVAAACGAAWAGVRWRARAGRGPFSRLLAAFAEDAAVAGLAAGAARAVAA